MKNYNRITLQERIEIEKLLALNLSYSAIALKLGRHKSSIVREVKKYPKKQYQAYYANLKSYARSIDRRLGKSKILFNPKLQKFVHQKLAMFWSPDQISVSLKRLFPNDKTICIHNVLSSSIDEKIGSCIYPILSIKKFNGEYYFWLHLE